jgi:hypothetical protein
MAKVIEGIVKKVEKDEMSESKQYSLFIQVEGEEENILIFASKNDMEFYCIEEEGQEVCLEEDSDAVDGWSLV